MRQWVSTFPPVGDSAPQIICNRVDLPKPLRPMMPTVSPFFTSKETSLSARIPCSKWGVGSGEKLPQRRNDPMHPRHDELFEPVARGVVDLVALAEVFDTNGDVGHFLVRGIPARGRPCGIRSQSCDRYAQWGVVRGLVAHFRHKNRDFDFFITQDFC